MNPLELLISALAPHHCLGCQEVGKILCDGCRLTLLPAVPSRCYRCHKVTLQSKTCLSCRRYGLGRVWVATSYEKTAKELVQKLKFERARSGSIEIAKCLQNTLPLLPVEDTIITFVPTAPSRVRARGYDQAKVIAKYLSKQTGIPFKTLLIRQATTRQVGAGRVERFKQLENAFLPKGIEAVKNKQILIVDDVLTTGATLESATKALKDPGIKKVDGVVFSQA